MRRKKIKIYRRIRILGIGIKIRNRKIERDPDLAWKTIQERFKDNTLTKEEMAQVMSSENTNKTLEGYQDTP